MMKKLFFLVFFIGLKAYAQNSDIAELSDQQISVVDGLVANAFAVHINNQIEIKKAVGGQPSFQAAINVVHRLVPHLNDADIFSKQRNTSMIHLVSNLLEGLALSNLQMETLRQELSPVLERYSISSYTNSVLTKIYDRHELWSGREFWYLKKLAFNNVEVVPYLETIVTTASQASPEEFLEFSRRLKAIPTYRLPVLLIQYKLGFLEPRQYKYLLQNLEIHFSSADKRASGMSKESAAALDRSALLVVKSLQERFISKDTTVSEAIRGRLAITNDPVVKMFYELFSNPEFSKILDTALTRSGRIDPLGLADQIKVSRDRAATLTLAAGPLSPLRCVEIFVLP